MIKPITIDDGWLDGHVERLQGSRARRQKPHKQASNGAALNVEKFSDFISIELPAFKDALGS